MLADDMGAWIWVVVVLGGTIVLGLMLAMGQLSWITTRFSRGKEARNQQAVEKVYEEAERDDNKTRYG